MREQREVPEKLPIVVRVVWWDLLLFLLQCSSRARGTGHRTEHSKMPVHEIFCGRFIDFTLPAFLCVRASAQVVEERLRYGAKRRKGESLVGWCPTALVLNFPIEYKSQQSYSITQNGLIWHTVDGLAGNSGLGSAFVTTSPDKPLKKSETRGVFGVRMLSPCILCSILTQFLVWKCVNSRC